MSDSVDWDAYNKLSPEEQKDFWKAERQKELEEDFQALMNAPFEGLRNSYYYRKYDREEAVQLQKMLEERLGVSDPEGEMPDEGWRQSNWCTD